MSPKQGVIYDVELSDGARVRVRFEGFGKFMHPIWRNVNTNEELAGGLPPYNSCVPIELPVLSNNDGFQTQVNTMPRTGDDARDFHSGCVAIQAAIKQALAMAVVPAESVNVTWAEPTSLVPQVGNFTVTANGRTATLEITRKRIIDSYERVGDPELLQAIRDLAHQLTK